MSSSTNYSSSPSPSDPQKPSWNHVFSSFGMFLTQTACEDDKNSLSIKKYSFLLQNLGNPIGEASMLGLGKGTRGGVPSVRIAVYKVCWDEGCNGMDILSAFDDATHGVDIISVSLGFDHPYDYFHDSLSIGAFCGMRLGILTVVAAGNDGPNHGSLKNLSPWSIVVGASNRKFNTKVQLGDGRIYEIYIVYMGARPQGVKSTKQLHIKIQDTMRWYPSFLIKKYSFLLQNLGNPIGEASMLGLGKGTRGGVPSSRIAVYKVCRDEGCNGMDILSTFDDAIKDGILMQGDAFRDVAQSFPLPGCYLNSKDGARIHKYIKHSRTPTATIFKSYELGDTIAPEVASFSSRGPNPITREILKPDLIAPGVDIITSWPPTSPVSEIIGDNRQLKFNIISETSMACPYVSGAAGYIKSFHPMWSHVAIHSALMTTATLPSPMNKLDTEFAYGAGQINSLKAINPGLIYDADERDYIRFLCGHGYNTTTLRLLTGDHNSTCSEAIINTTTRDLNIPSFTLQAPGIKCHISGSFKRNVTNVGSPVSTYNATIISHKRLNIQVNPSVLSFTALGQKHTFVLTIDGALRKSSVSASLIWDDGEFTVQSPIIVSGTKIGLEHANLIYISTITLTFVYP